MTKAAFDTLKFAKRLEEAGFSADQAAGTAAAFGEAMVEILANVATKADFAELRAEVRHELSLMRRDLIDMELRITIKLGAMLATGIAVMVALLKLL